MNTQLRHRGTPERALESLYRRHARDVYRYSLTLLPRQADAEDATQTTFLNAYKALERGEQPRDGRKWLRAIATNVCREHYRRARRHPEEIPLEEDPGELVLDPPTHALGDVLRGLAALPFNQRAALVLREFEGRPLTEISEQLTVSVSAVETLLFRARRTLREQLEEAITCEEAERAISRQLDRALPRGERGPLRAHLRACPECAALARRMRAARGRMSSLAAALPLPASLSLWKLLGNGAAPSEAITAPSSAGLAAVSAKLAALALTGATIAGAGYVSLHQDHDRGRLTGARVAASPSASPRRLSTAHVVVSSTGPARSNEATRRASHSITPRSSRASSERALGRRHRAPAAQSKSSAGLAHGNAYAYGRAKPTHGDARGQARGRGRPKTGPGRPPNAPRPGHR
jgi:RNA polymerase sigma factor (sigma-70 family)